uniref:Cytochrome P450 n=1 Tax=Timema shepardi TaxID=629360 RepID=A0A7R9AKK3_TIMSH|nr:unnamed protein product [Timema shepardi]
MVLCLDKSVSTRETFIMGLLFESLYADIIVGVITLFLSQYLIYAYNCGYWKRKGIPYIPLPTSILAYIGSLSFSKTSSTSVITDYYHKLEGKPYGGIYSNSRPVLLVRDPETIKHVFVKDFNYFVDRPIVIHENVNPLEGNLLMLKGEKWRWLRAKLTPTFTSGKIRMMFNILINCAAEVNTYLNPIADSRGTIEMKDLMAKYGTDIIGTCAFGLQFNSLKNPDSEFRAMGRKILHKTRIQMLNMMLSIKFPFLANLLKVTYFNMDASNFFLGVVKETVEHREKNNIQRNDFLQLLIQLKNKGYLLVSEMTDDLLAAQCFVFFLAGFETSSSTISSCLYELALNPEIQERLREEVDTVLHKYKGAITYEAIQEMDYLARAIDETLRKYPPKPNLDRQCTKTFTFPGTNHMIEKGTRLTIPAYALHHDPKYFPDPEQFNPDRFTEEAKRTRHHYSYLPFGEGPRICIGMRFGLMQTKVDIAVGVFTLLLFVYLRYSYSYGYWKRKGITYIPVPTSIFGHVGDLILSRKPAGTVTMDLYNKLEGKPYGGIFTITSPVLLVRDPEIIKQVFVKDFDHFIDRSLNIHEKINPLEGNLFMLKGDRWRWLRTKITPTFTSGKLKMMFHVLSDCASEMNAYVSPVANSQGSLEFREVIAKYTTDIIGTCAFGLQFNSLKNPDSEFRAMGRKIFQASAIKKAKIMLANAIPFLAELFNIKLNDGLLAAQCFVFFLAGFETSSTTVSFCLYELALNPEIQERLREEVDTVLHKYKGAITYEAIQEMDYLSRVVDGEQCTKEFTFTGTNHVIEKGIKLIIPVYALHHDPKYFPDPEQFNPDRFTEEAKRTRHNYSYLPFGEGPRICIGMRFGLMQTKVGLVSLLSKYKFSPCEKTSIPMVLNPKSSIPSSMNGIWLKITNRE